MKIDQRGGGVSFLWQTVLCGILAVGFASCQRALPSQDAGEFLREGWNLYRLSEFNAAVKKFQALQKLDQASQVEGWYGEASCWNHRRDGRDVAKAASLYRQVVERAPDSPLGAWSALDLVRIEHLAPPDQPVNYGKVIEGYEEVHRRYPNSPAGVEALLYSCSLRLAEVNIEDTRRIRARMEAWLQAHPETRFFSEFQRLLAECCHRLGEEQKRLEYLIGSLETREVDAANPVNDRATAYWDIAYAAEFDAGDFGTARAYYRKLIEEYPQDIRVFGIRQAFARMDAVEAAVRQGREVDSANAVRQ